METPKRKRRPYKRYLQFGSVEEVPRKTKSNWDRREITQNGKEKDSKVIIRSREGTNHGINEPSRDAVRNMRKGGQYGAFISRIDQPCNSVRKMPLEISCNDDVEKNTELPSLHKPSLNHMLDNNSLNFDNTSPHMEFTTHEIDESTNLIERTEPRLCHSDNGEFNSEHVDSNDTFDHEDNIDMSFASNNHAQPSPRPFLPEDIDSSAAEVEDLLQGYSTKKLVHLLVVLATKMRHTGTYRAAEDMSEMIEIMKEFPDQPQSKYKFKTIMKLLSTSLSIHHFCDRCKGYGGKQAEGDDNAEEDPKGILICESCQSEIDISENWKIGKTFLYLSLRSQLAEIFGRHGDSIMYSKSRKKKCSYAIEDIYDGRMYKKKMNNDISINFSVDGVPIFDSSKYGMNPVVCTINELAPEKRPVTMLLCSLYCGGKVPNINAYLTPFVRECNELYNSGFTYNYMGQQYMKKCRLLCGICDSIARREVRNVTQFNGRYGCGFCKHPGEQVPKGAGTVRVYPVDADGNAFGEGPRTHDETLKHAESLKKGVQGRSVLFDAEGVDVIKCLPPDWQHNVALGVVRQFAHLWLDSEYHGEDFYCGTKLKLVDDLLLSFKPTLDVSRTPRKMSERSYWKAHEWVILLLFYSLPVLRCILPIKYVDHWALLVDAIAILTSRSILPTDVYYAENCLNQFVQGTEALYGKKHISYNVHLLLHLPESVINWGPLWTHSAFGYENYYQKLLSFVKSSNSPPLQICSSFRLQYVVDKLYDICQPYLTEAQEKYLDKMIHNKVRPPVSLHLKSVSLLGKAIVRKLKPEDFLALQRLDVVVHTDASVRYYKRMLMNDEIFHSASYTKPTKRQSFFVLTKDSEIFEIERLIVLEGEKNLKCYAVGYYHEKENRSLMLSRRLSHMTWLKQRSTSLAALPTDSIQEKVVFIEMKSCNLLLACKHPNRCELLT